MKPAPSAQSLIAGIREDVIAARHHLEVYRTWMHRRRLHKKTITPTSRKRAFVSSYLLAREKAFWADIKTHTKGELHYGECL